MHLRVCVWNRIGHVNLIQLIIKFEVKAACVIGFWFVRIHLVNFNVVRRDVVVDIEAAVVPALTIRVVAFDGPKTRLHSIIEQRVTLGKIDNIIFSQTKLNKTAGKHLTCKSHIFNI